MKLSAAIKIMQEALASAGDMNVAFCFDVDDEGEIGFMYPEVASVVGGDNEPDCLAFMHRGLLELLVDECPQVELPAMIRVVNAIPDGEVH